MEDELRKLIEQYLYALEQRDLRPSVEEMYREIRSRATTDEMVELLEKVSRL